MSIGCVSASDDMNATDTISLDDNSDLMSSGDEGDFEELQTLINNANDTVELTKDYKGSGMITIDKDLKIIGNGHSIDANSNSSIFFITSNVVLDNIKFFNAYDGEFGGAAIYAFHSLEIFDCDFYDCYADYGAAIVSLGSLYVYNSFFDNNRAEKYASCIYAENHTEIYDSYFETKYDGLPFINYYDNDDDNSGYLFLDNNTMISPYMWSIWYEGDTPIKSPTSLEFTKLAFDTPENMTIAFVFDNAGNTIIMDSINAEIYDSNNTLIDSTSVKFDWENGYAYTNANLTPGKYRTTGSIDSAYASDFKVTDGTITILREDEKISTEVTVSSKIAEKQATLTALVLPNSATGTVTFTLAGKSHNVTLVNGTATLTVSDLDYGTYTVKTTYSGDKNYEASDAEDISFTISKTISAPDLEKYYKGPERFVVTLKGIDAKPIADGKVKITINGQVYERTTDSTGTASMAINLPAGDYKADVEYGEEKVTSSVRIKSTLEGNDLTKMFRNASQYYIKVLDSNGNPLSGQKVKFNINGVFYERDINASGIARLNINLEPKTYTITAENPSNGEMYSNTITVKPTIIENRDLTKYYRNDSQYIIKVLDDQGNPVKAGVSVEFNINGVFYTRQSDSTGHVKMNINLQPGNYVITAIYNGMMVSNNVRVLSILSGKDIVMEYKDGTRYEATLLDGQGRRYAGQTVQFNINGVLYDRETDANGVARLNINLGGGRYIITATYNQLSISNTITINVPVTEYNCRMGHKLTIPTSVTVYQSQGETQPLDSFYIYYDEGLVEFDVQYDKSEYDSSFRDTILTHYVNNYGASFLGYYNGWGMLNMNGYPEYPNYVMWYGDRYMYSIWTDNLNLGKRVIESFS